MDKSIDTAATVVAYTIDPEKADALRDALEQHLVPAASRIAGYRGFLVLDQGQGKRLGIVLFDSIEQARAAQEPIKIAARDHGVYEMMAERPGGSIGTAIVADGVFGAAR